MYLQLPIGGFLPVQHLDKFRFLNFDYTSVCVKYGKTLSYPMNLHFFKGHLLFYFLFQQFCFALDCNFSLTLIHSWHSPAISAHRRVKFLIPWKYPFFKKIGNKFLTLCMSGSKVFFKFDRCYFFRVQSRYHCMHRIKWITLELSE